MIGLVADSEPLWRNTHTAGLRTGVFSSIPKVLLVAPPKPSSVVAPPLVARAGSWRVVEVDGYLRQPLPPPFGTSSPVGYKYFSPAGPVHTWRSSRPGPAAIKQQQGQSAKRQQRNLAIWVSGPCHFSVVGPIAAGLMCAGFGTTPGCNCTGVA